MIKLAMPIMACQRMQTLMTMFVTFVSVSTEQTVPSHLLAASPTLRPYRFGRPWKYNTDVPVRYHIAMLCNWIDEDDFKKKEMVNGFQQNVAKYMIMFETNTEWNVTRIHQQEFDKLKNNVFDLVIEVGARLSLEAKNSLPYTPRFVRVQFGNEYLLDQATFIHDVYKNANRKIYSHTDRLWISPHYEYSSTYLAVMHNTTVRVTPFIWSARPSLRVQTDVDFDQAVTAGKRDIVIVAPNMYTQKSSLLPLVIVNELWKKNPNAFDKVWVVSSSQSFECDFWASAKSLLGQLQVYWSSTNKASFSSRSTFEGILSKGPKVLIEHQHSWGLNYLTLEAIHTRTPLVHNSPYFRNEGFFYNADNVTAGVEQLERALAEFAPRDYDDVIASFHPDNPEVLAVYSDLVQDAMVVEAPTKSAQHCADATASAMAYDTP